MIEKMKKVYICSFAEQSLDILEDIMRCGVVETTMAESMLEPETAEGLIRKKEVNLSKEEQLLERISLCISALKPYGKKKGLFEARPAVRYEQLTDDQSLMKMIGLCEDVERVSQDIASYTARKRELEFKSAALEPWEALDVSADALETGTCATVCYILPENKELKHIEEEAKAAGLPVVLTQICEERNYKYFTALFHRQDEAQVRSLIAGFGAKEQERKGWQGTVKENRRGLEKEAAQVNALIEGEQDKRKALAWELPKLQMAYDSVKVRLDCLHSQDKLLSTEKVDVITGWVPAAEKERLDAQLAKYSCFCRYEEPEKEEEFPVLMKNSKLVAPFSAITEMYSLPDSRSMDSNWAIAFFFFLFFGMMLSDAGYGLLLFVGGMLGARKLDLGEGAKRMLKMLGLCGISTMFWGLLYGSFFGDAIPTVTEVFFGKRVALPMLIDPLNEPMLILGISCALGVIHLFTGMGLRAYLMIRRGDRWGALFDVGFWYILLIGLPLLLLPGAGKTVGIAMSVGGALGLVLTQGRKKPTLAGKITSGVMSLYDVTGYFSDVLSYSRILALGLATGVVASVVNIMGSMAGGGIIGAILFAAVFAFGHALNMGINALGAYVHSARLQYVEFFGKYYESGGKKFNPLKINTKYTRVTED